MSKYLISTVETYRADTEEEAAQIINESKHDSRFTLAKYSSVKKSCKKTEDEWVNVSLTKKFNDEKFPDSEVNISYDSATTFTIE